MWVDLWYTVSPVESAVHVPVIWCADSCEFAYCYVLRRFQTANKLIENIYQQIFTFATISVFQMLSNNTSNHTNTNYQLKISNLHGHFELSLSGALHKCMI